MRAGWFGVAAASLAAIGSIWAAAAQAPPPPATLTQPPPGGAPPPAATASPSRPPLVAESGDPANVDEVVLPERSVLVLSGSGTWTEALKTIRAAFGKLDAELGRLGVAPAGRPIAMFGDTTDDNFQFQAMIPVGAVSGQPPAPAGGMTWGKSPSGKAYRFVHKGSYDDIDTTYETITTYLEAKDIVAKDAFLEEYLNDVSDPNDANLEVNIYVQPRDGTAQPAEGGAKPK